MRSHPLKGETNETTHAETRVLQRLVIDYRSGELVVRCLYRSEAKDCPNPGTKARLREVEDLAREGLGAALAALEGDVDVVGTSGFTTREDVLLATASLPTRQPMRKGA